jgi:hypothetical protein
VWVEIRPATFIENLSLAYEFKNNFSRDCTNEKANAFVARKPKTVEETVVQIRKPCHAYILSLMQVASGEKSP